MELDTWGRDKYKLYSFRAPLYLYSNKPQDPVLIIQDTCVLLQWPSIRQEQLAEAHAEVLRYLMKPWWFRALFGRGWSFLRF